jgi:hypothetical protein
MMNNEINSLGNEAQVQPAPYYVTNDPHELLRSKSKILLEAMYDEMILWNMRQEEMPLYQYLGLSPQDYLHFMRDPEGWAFEYMARRLQTRF